MIHPTATVADNSIIGDGTKVWHYAHIREFSQIGKGCVIGKDVYIDQGVTIGDRCKIENGVSVYKGVSIGDDVIVGPNVTFTNDLYPRAFKEDWEIISTIIRRGVGIGAGAVIVCGVRIGEYALIGAGSVVCTDVFPYSLFYGNPARFISCVCKCGKRVASMGEKCGSCKY